MDGKPRGPAVTWVEPRDPAVNAEVAAVASRMKAYLTEVADDVRDVIAEKLPTYRGDERLFSMFGASVQENLNTGLHILQHEGTSAVAPNAAREFARRLAQRGVGVSSLMRSYRVGQARFQRDFISELLRGRGGDRVEGNAALTMVRVVSDYVDAVVEQLLEAYGEARDEWLSHRSAVFVQRVRTLLSERDIGADDAQQMLGSYRLSQRHRGAVIWCDEASSGDDVLHALNRYCLQLAEAAGCVEPPLFVPLDDASAWVWMPLGSDDDGWTALESAAAAPPEAISVGLGEPLPSLAGFRRTHQQAVMAQCVAVAARPSRSRFMSFTEVAPIATMCADLDAARTWVAETLGPLAADDERGSMLRETARVFLGSGGSFTATASQMMLHRNTAQYRVRKAEELRGRPLRDGRLDVELALLACRYFGTALLQPAQPDDAGSVP
jgi:hypothetical protein